MFKMSTCLLTAALLCGQAFAASDAKPTTNPNEQPDVASLSVLLAKMDALQARFQQRTLDERGELLQEASGTVTVKRPRRLLWKTIDPFEHLLVTNGNDLWLYDIDLEQASRQDFTPDLDKAPALLLSGELDAISDQYQVSLSNEGNEQVFTLLPTNSDSVFQTMSLNFVDGSIKSMTLEDNLNQRTLIQFDQVELNPQINDQVFEFSPPAGVDVSSS